MPVIVFFELGIALVLVVAVWGWLRWHRPRQADKTTDRASAAVKPPPNDATL